MNSKFQKTKYFNIFFIFESRFKPRRYSSISDTEEENTNHTAAAAVANEDQSLHRINTSESQFLLSLDGVLTASMSESQLDNSSTAGGNNMSLPLINISELGNTQSEQDLLNSILSNTAEIEREETNIEKGFKRHKFENNIDYLKRLKYSVIYVLA